MCLIGQDRYHRKVAQAGFQEHAIPMGKARIHFVEGPQNGPALVLLHAQHMDWFSYSRVLPALSERFHVFAVDYYGHGGSTAPPEYMNVQRTGGDLARWLKLCVREPAYLSGNSSGGLLSVWLAANESDWVRAVVLEDPPLFSSQCPRLHQTVADKSFSVCSRFLQEGGEDFLLYWIDSCRPFFRRYVGWDVTPLLKRSIRRYRKRYPGRPVELWYLPVTVRLMLRGMSCYDPHFGAAFHEGSWNAGFAHAEALARISCPVLLLHADFAQMSDGTFAGAMDQQEAERAIAAIPYASYLRLHAQHVIHLDQPKRWIDLLESFFLDGVCPAEP